MQTGKSYGEGCDQGKRRRAQDANGNTRVLAPRHFRKMGRHYMDDLTDAEIASVYFGFKNFDDIKKKVEKSIQGIKGQKTKLQKKLDNLPENDKCDAVQKEIRTDIETKLLEEDKKICEQENIIDNIRTKVQSFRDA